MAFFLATPSNSANSTLASTSPTSSPTPQASVTSSPKRKGKQRQLEPDPGGPEQQRPFLEEPQQQHHHEALTSPRLHSLTIGAYGVGAGGEDNGLLTPLTSHTMVAEHRDADIDESGWDFGYSFGVDVSRVLDFAGSGSESGMGSPSPLASGSSVSSGLSSGFGTSDGGMSATTRVESSRRATMGDTTLRTIATTVSGEAAAHDHEYEATVGDRSAGWGDLLVRPPRFNATPGPSHAVLQDCRNGDWAGVSPAAKVREEDAGLKTHRRRPSSGLTTQDKTKSRTSTHHRRRSSRGGKVDEPGFSRDFLLIVALCVGVACASVCIVRPAMMAWWRVAYYEDPLDLD